jgi:hypothetical protein
MQILLDTAKKANQDFEVAFANFSQAVKVIKNAVAM